MSAGTAPPSDAVPLHRQSLDFEAFDMGAELLVVRRVGDARPWAEHSPDISTVHDRDLEVTVGLDTWADGGVAEQKPAAGWRPGVGPYPSLPLETMHRSSDSV